MFVRTSINFASYASFQTIEFVDRPVPKTLDVLGYEMSVWCMVLSKAFSKLARNARHYDSVPPPTPYPRQIWRPERERPVNSDSHWSSNNIASFIIFVISPRIFLGLFSKLFCIWVVFVIVLSFLLDWLSCQGVSNEIFPLSFTSI